MHILVADNNDHTRETIGALLEDFGHSISLAENADQAMHVFRSAKPDIVILDLVLVGIDGLELLATIKAERPETEVIVMTSFPSLDSVIEAMRLEALDYLVKTAADLELLVNSVQRAIRRIDERSGIHTRISGMQAEVERLQGLNNRLLSSGRKDQSTGLPDQQLFRETLDAEINRSGQNQRRFSIIFIYLNPDIDFGGENFELRAIDSAMPNWARMLKERLRKSDILGRYDDRTMSIILPETGKEGAMLVAETIVHLCHDAIQTVMGEDIPMSRLLQVGIACYPEDGSNLDDLLETAGPQTTGNFSGSVH